MLLKAKPSGKQFSASAGARYAASGSKRALKEDLTMEMHSRDSLYHTHGINTERRRPRPRRWVWALFGWIRRSFVEFKQAIETEFAVRQAIIELRDMDNHMLRDLGITRAEIESAVRRPSARIGTEEAPAISSDESSSIVPRIISPSMASDARRECQAVCR
jgi:uncharacterized protein YjiS (DUF1127 family)